MSRNPDGVMFYKIWNGRHDPRMPAFKSEMTKEEVWEVVTYITTSLRPAGSP
jgi:mono/diheme cytochrome c family protein